MQNPMIDAYLAALPAGRAPRILGSRILFVADSRKVALKLAELGLNRVADRFAAAGHRIEGRTLNDLIKALDSHVGTPEDVIATLKTDRALERTTDLVFQAHSIDPPHEAILRSIELIAAEVAPALGWSPQTTPTRVAAE